MSKQSEQALTRLREMVFSGEMGPGTNHFEADLADKLGMSRTPIREAALTMQAQGLVEVVPRRGIRVLPVSAKDMGDIFDLLSELESLAAARAANRNLSEIELSHANACVDLMDDALARNDTLAWSDADEAFHSELMRLSGNPRISEVFERYRDKVRRARIITLTMRPSPVQSNKDHRAVLEAIKLGYSDRARAIHRDHVTRARTMIVELIKETGLKSL